MPKTFEIILASFERIHKLDNIYFFSKIFILKIRMKMILKICFFNFKNADLQFANKKLI